MNCYSKEQNLIPHYDDHVNYWTFTKDNKFLDNLFKRFNIELNLYNNLFVLDLGCGTGNLGRYFYQKQSSINYVGVDFSKNRIEEAKTFEKSNVQFIKSDIHEYVGNETVKYDIITLFEVLEHLEEPKQLLDKCKYLLKENGVILASVPHNMPYKAHLQVYTSENDVINKINPKQIFKLSTHRQYFCKWTH